MMVSLDFWVGKKMGLWTYEVQARENDWQRRAQKVWDAILSDYGKGYFGCKSVLMGCYTLWLSKAFFSK
jgi:hypothetical protein